MKFEEMIVLVERSYLFPNGPSESYPRWVEVSADAHRTRAVRHVIDHIWINHGMLHRFLERMEHSSPEDDYHSPSEAKACEEALGKLFLNGLRLVTLLGHKPDEFSGGLDEKSPVLLGCFEHSLYTGAFGNGIIQEDDVAQFRSDTNDVARLAWALTDRPFLMAGPLSRHVLDLLYCYFGSLGNMGEPLSFSYTHWVAQWVSGKEKDNSSMEPPNDLTSDRDKSWEQLDREGKLGHF